jgi:imidazolonepropionase
MTRRAVTGTGRLLPMARARARGTAAIDGPWTVLMDGGVVTAVRASGLRPGDPEDVVDVGSALCTPGLVDPHTHLAFVGDRSDEAAARSRGERYTGGGILRTVRATTDATDEDLVRLTRGRLRSALGQGTTTIEVKSGYGLVEEQELRQLRLIALAAGPLPLRVVRTYLGAHAVPDGWTPTEHAWAVIESMPRIALEADQVDVFCEPSLFDLGLTRAILEAGRRHGLGLRLHADQLRRSGAALLGSEMGALSVDHLEQATDSDARALGATDTAATILPGPALLLHDGLPPVAALLASGAIVAIGSDANAGTFGEPSMPLAIGLAAMMGFSIDDALWAATAGAARALGLAGRVGSIEAGMAADLVAWDAEHEGAFLLRPGAVWPAGIWIEGERVGEPGDEQPPAGRAGEHAA